VGKTSLIKAIAQLPLELRQRTEVAVVGFSAPELKKEIVDLTLSSGVGEKVRFTGLVSVEDFRGYARAADVCVQLRYPTRGETSAALLKEMSVGAACVTSDFGPMAEIPDGVVLKVRSPGHEVEDLTKALILLAGNPSFAEKMRIAARRHVEDNHSIARGAEAYTEAINAAIAACALATVWSSTRKPHVSTPSPSNARLRRVHSKIFQWVAGAFIY
jgi:glycosyltransferase involved in cell wall biosynthesis